MAGVGSLKCKDMNRKFYILLVAVMMTAFLPSCKKPEVSNTIIITGQDDSHNWEAGSSVLKEILDATGLFASEIVITPEKGGDIQNFNPDFSKYDLVVMNYCGEDWSETAKENFVDFVKDGGGVVIFHSASIPFPGWNEYNEMTGLGGWNDRNEKDGPYVYYTGNEPVIDTTSGIAGSHGERHEFEIRNRFDEHPVTKDLPVRWMHGSDELYQQLRGPAKNMQVLATAFADTAFGGTGRHEPVLMAINYEEGRIFHTTLGHTEDENSPAIQCAGFIVTLQRGAEWAATGNVTQELPSDFPTTAGVVLRPGLREISLDEAFMNIVSYDIDKSTKYLTFIRDKIRKAAGDEKQLVKLEKKMVDVLKNPDATKEAKKIILRELSWMGSDYCIPVIKSLESDPELSDNVEFALTRLQK